MVNSRTLLIVLIAAFAPSCGCDKAPSASAERGTAASAPAPRHDADAVARLKSLPYAGFVGEEEDTPSSGVVRLDRSRSQAGHTLYTMERLARAELIDLAGEVIRSWSDPDGKHWYHTELLPGGDLLVVGARRNPAGENILTDADRYVARYAWNGNLLWRADIAGHHDIEETPSGKLMVMTIRRRSEPALSADVLLRDEELTLLSPDDGTVLDSLSLYDAIRRSPDVFPLHTVAPKPRGGETELDLLHSNSCEWLRYPELAERNPLYASDNVLVCFRNQDRIAIFNWSEKRAVWAWGDGELSGPHDATLLPNGNIQVFDNGISNERSRVLELDPLTRQIVREYAPTDGDRFFTLTKGSAQRLPNGNLLIANSDSGHAFEIAPGGEKVSEFFCPHRGTDGKRATIVRAIRYFSIPGEATGAPRTDEPG